MYICVTDNFSDNFSDLLSRCRISDSVQSLVQSHLIASQPCKGCSSRSHLRSIVYACDSVAVVSDTFCASALRTSGPGLLIVSKVVEQTLCRQPPMRNDSQRYACGPWTSPCVRSGTPKTEQNNCCALPAVMTCTFKAGCWQICTLQFAS